MHELQYIYWYLYDYTYISCYIYFFLDDLHVNCVIWTIISIKCRYAHISYFLILTFRFVQLFLSNLKINKTKYVHMYNDSMRDSVIHVQWFDERFGLLILVDHHCYAFFSLTIVYQRSKSGENGGGVVASIGSGPQNGGQAFNTDRQNFSF